MMEEMNYDLKSNNAKFYPSILKKTLGMMEKVFMETHNVEMAENFLTNMCLNSDILKDLGTKGYSEEELKELQAEADNFKNIISQFKTPTQNVEPVTIGR